MCLKWRPSKEKLGRFKNVVFLINEAEFSQGQQLIEFGSKCLDPNGLTALSHSIIIEPRGGAVW